MTRHTFCLDGPGLELLHQFAQQLGMSHSQVLRILLSNIAQQTKEEQQKLLDPRK